MTTTQNPAPTSPDRPAGCRDSAVQPDVAAARAAAIAIAVDDVERLPLLDARGRVLARAVRSLHAIPPFDNSAMDGYAVRTADFAGAGPWTFRLAGRRVAGDHADALPQQAMAAVRIFTGAPVPDRFDAVVMQENVSKTGDGIVIAAKPAVGHNIRRKGEDVEDGAALAAAGEALTPQKLALFAGAGLADTPVFRKVRIGLISTGSELRDPGEPLAPGQIHNSNRVMLRAMLAEHAWAEVEDFGIVADDRTLLEQTLMRASHACDAIISTGGVSAGEEDHVAAILRESGARLEVVRVAMRPGKPVKIGLIGRTLFAGLPGNPNSALVTFRRIALPALRAMAGLQAVEPAWQPGIAGFTFPKRPGRTEFVPVRFSGEVRDGVPVLDVLARGSSASLTAMAQADGIAQLPPEDEAITPGTVLRFERF